MKYRKLPKEQENNKKIGLRIGIVILIIIAALGLFFAGYTGNYYHAANPEEAVSDTENVNVIPIDTGYLYDGPGEDDALIFYPGAKVETIAYGPLMKKLAAKGIDCFLVEMPFHLAVFGINKADTILKTYGADYSHWYMAGHSLGGAMAANYISKHENDFDGLVLLGAYTATDLSELDIRTVNIYGTNDGVLNMDKLSDSYDLMPEDSRAVQIAGGNHAQFGDYGEQKGDGAAEISAEEQQRQTADAIAEFIAEDQ